MQIVIARYNENLDWTKGTGYQYTIYNKGDNFEFDSIRLSNIGRESDTYLNHIINNYDNLSDATAFVQGEPFFHSPNLFESIAKYSGENFYDLCCWKTISDLNGGPHHPCLNITDVYQQLFNQEVDFTELSFGAGAQFIASKSAILSKPKDWWIKAYQVHTLNDLSPWIFERLWPKIFN